MGRKGVSKRKAKKIKTVPGENIAGSVSKRQEESSPVQALISNIATKPPQKTKGKKK